MFEQAKTKLVTLRDWLRYAVSRFNEAELFFGHGSREAHDEAAYLILHALHLPIDRLDPYLDARLLPFEAERVASLLERRIKERKPAAYITGEAWLHGYRFRVDERVLIPRSFLAGLILERFAPWLPAPEEVRFALDLCTGSGCLAILIAHAFPEAQVDAVDVSPGALEVAWHNVADYGLDRRVELIESDLFAGLGGRRYDLIVCNPPYVDAEAMARLPPEYRYEPKIGLAAGEDGLDVIRRVLQNASHHLNPYGLLALEIGHNRPVLEAAFPHIEFIWPEVEGGEDMVCLISREQLPR